MNKKKAVVMEIIRGIDVLFRMLFRVVFLQGSMMPIDITINRIIHNGPVVSLKNGGPTVIRTH